MAKCDKCKKQNGKRKPLEHLMLCKDCYKKTFPRWQFGERCKFTGFNGGVVAVGMIVQPSISRPECQGIIIYHKINPLLIGDYLSWSISDKDLKKDNEPTKEQWNKYQQLLKGKFRKKNKRT
jgi:hypothetical protein